MSFALPAFVQLLAGLALLSASYPLARVRRLPRPQLGLRGLRRAPALCTWFGAIEPVVAWLGGLIAKLPLDSIRDKLDPRIAAAGELLGLCADEVLALSVLGAVSISALAAGALGLGVNACFGLAMLGGALPWVALDEAARSRRRALQRELPAAIDVMALCMDAGLDFAAALSLVAKELARPDATLGEELTIVLQQIAIGAVRAQALSSLYERVPSPVVRDFVHAVQQGEQRGHPMAETLEVQAQVMRMRRSAAAEEAAARASVMLVMPMMLLMSAVMLLLFGPLIVRGGF